ncbi:MAG: hypothetical protein HY722_03210 [Planctomycetes bacterium]|nr:hypothetical protein [Planctomycetota bacterium]
MRSVRIQRVLPLLVCLLSPAVWAGPWEEVRRESGVTVSRREVDGTPIVAFKGEGLIDASLEKVLGVLADNEHRTEWVDRLAQSVVLERPSPWEFIVYQRFALPFPMSDRDYVYRARVHREEGTGRVLVEMASEEHPDAPATAGVRARLHRSAYALESVEGGSRTRVEVEILTDPRGWVPAWLVNLIQESWPLNTLQGIRAQVQKPYVEGLSLPEEGPDRTAQNPAPPAATSAGDG